ncbi:MAG: Glyoxylate/hydroxypyruvate reductase B [Verrucomicrobiae bacterium]|nr:Glyoxylate/hydroxypyruvate reductase B [Verrucomicrobiae bacterium]
MNVFLTRQIPAEALEILQKTCRQLEVADSEIPLTIERLQTGARGRDGILIMGNDRADAALFDAAGNQLRCISNFSVGTNNIDIAEATRRRITVTNTPGVLTETTADLTWALLLAVTRRIVEGDRFARSGSWRGWTPTQFLGADISGKTLGIVGAGRIGTAVAKRAAGFNMRVLTFTSRNTRVEFETLLRESDFITVHVPLTPATKHLFGEKEFLLMKPTAYFINVARGPVHDEAALVNALRQNRIAGAGLDVFEEEPKIHPGLLDLENVVLIPHLGSATIETRRRMAIMAAENLISVLAGRPCPNIVNPL